MMRLRVFGSGLVALALSGALHGAGLLAVVPQTNPALVAGGGAADLAAVGAAFEDFVAGTVPVTSAAQSAVPPVVAARSLALPASTVADVAAPVVPDRATSAPVVTSATPAAPQDPARQVQPETTAAAPDTAPVTSMRPVARPAPARQVAAPAPAGNADTDAARGSTQGQAQGQAAASGAAAAADSSGGQAAAAAYPQEVLRQITRLRPERTRARGTVVVRFAIAGSGALADVAVAQSSGSAALDGLALDHIRRAAPFPPPPPGAQTTFSFEFAGRA